MGFRVELHLLFYRGAEIARVDCVIKVFQVLFNGENGLYITEFKGTFKETVYLQDITVH